MDRAWYDRIILNVSYVTTLNVSICVVLDRPSGGARIVQDLLPRQKLERVIINMLPLSYRLLPLIG